MQVRLQPIEPPRAGEIELRVLSALSHIGEPHDLKVQKAMLALDRYCFLNFNYRTLYEIIAELFKQGKEFSFVTLLGLLPKQLSNLCHEMVKDEYISTAYLESDIEQLLAFKVWRSQIQILTRAVNLSFEATTPEASINAILDEVQKLKQTSNTRKSFIRSYETIADDFLESSDIDDSQFKVAIEGLPMVPNRALITIAGRSGHGKTFFALYLMDKIIDEFQDKHTLYFNLEMHELVMMERHAKLLGIQGNSRKEIISNGIAKLLPKNVSLISEPMLTIEEIETECRLSALKQPLAVIVVDYIGLVRSKIKSERKDLEQGDIAKRLAALSLELNCVVIALIQVNRDIKSRQVGDRCPIPTDSAESMGSVHSSSWWLGIDQPQNDSDNPDLQHLFMVQCRKNRGESGLFNLNLKFQGGRFSKWERLFCKKYVQSNDDPTGF